MAATTEGSATEEIPEGVPPSDVVASARAAELEAQIKELDKVQHEIQ